MATADGDGDTVSTQSYDPWGNPGSALPSDQTTHGYVGADDKQTDSTTGLVLMGARPYDPATGRFLSVDPIDGGSLNNYDYAGQDPIDGYDLEGTCTKKESHSWTWHALSPACLGTAFVDDISGRNGDFDKAVAVEFAIAAPLLATDATIGDVSDASLNALKDLARRGNSQAIRALARLTAGGGTSILQKIGDCVQGAVDTAVHKNPASLRPCIELGIGIFKRK